MADNVQEQGQAPEQGTPGPVPYERFKEINDALKDAQKRLAQIEEEGKAAKAQKLTDEKRWQELAQQRENELLAERAARLRLGIAMSKGIPPALADRLQGADKEAMEKDADMILAQIAEAAKGKQGPGVPPPPQGGRPAVTDLSKMTPDEIRQQTPALLKQTRS